MLLAFITLLVAAHLYQDTPVSGYTCTRISPSLSLRLSVYLYQDTITVCLSVCLSLCLLLCLLLCICIIYVFYSIRLSFFQVPLFEVGDGGPSWINSGSLCVCVLS